MAGIRGIKPDQALWAKVNKVIMDENMGTVIITFTSAICQMLIQAKACDNEDEARAQLAAMLLSPSDKPGVGSLLPLLNAELAKLKGDRWLA